MKSKRYFILMLVVVVGLCMASCGSGKKAAATAAVQAAEDAFKAAKPELLMKYVPDETKGVEDAINGAKASLDKRDYNAALTAAQAIPDKVKKLTAAAAAKKDELTKSWQETSSGIPKMLQTIRGKLTILTIPEEVPPNLDKTKIKAASNGYEEAAAMWEEAKNAFSAGNLSDATAKAKTVREKAMEIMTTLGIKAPATPTKG